GLVAGLYIVLGILELVRSRILTRIGAQIDQRMNRRVFDGSMQMSLQTGGSTSATAPLRELGVVQQFLSGPALPALFDAPWVPVYIGIIFLFHPNLGFLALAAEIVLFIIAVLNDIRSRKPISQTSKATAAANQIADTGRRNAEVLAAMSMLGPVRERWNEQHNEAINHEVQARDRTGTLSAISKSLRLFLQSAMLAAGAALVIFGQITPGVMIAASIILGRALQPVEQAIAHWRGLVQFRQSQSTLKEFLEKLPPPQERMPLPDPKGKIDVRGLHIGVPGTRKLILKNVNFSLEPGKILGIVGLSAAGKSSLARALVGVWKPASGEIRLDGATFDQWSPELLGRHIGYLPQDVELFEGTIKENISRFEENPDAEIVIDAAKLAGIHEMVMQLGGYDFQVGNLGSNLSAGQRQRLALARAIYKNPAFIVLDEPNSNLDEVGEIALAKALSEIRDNGQTIVIITHRMKILGLTDFLLELTNGVQTEFGPRDEVVAKIRAKQTPPGDTGSSVHASNNNAMMPIKATPGTFEMSIDSLPAIKPTPARRSRKNSKPGSNS
ncbi:MAG: type I secretion system permease/ATPase, partial [Devosiaceae bacterium]|nr:type I secretion system permease/ATPase [Devosiaceae bacterium]